MDHLYTKEVVTCSEMKALEKAADAAGLSYYQMMENAGTQAFSLILQRRPHTEKAVVFCGKGNNGGDGFVVARKFFEAGIQTQVVLIEGEPVTDDAKTNYQLIRKTVQILTAGDAAAMQRPDTIVDAIYGTGFHGKLRSPADRIIERINQSGAYVAALDIPSGLCGDLDDEDPGSCVKADLTITFHAKKPVHCGKSAARVMGEIVTADIGIREIMNGDIG